MSHRVENVAVSDLGSHLLWELIPPEVPNLEVYPLSCYVFSISSLLLSLMQELVKVIFDRLSQVFVYVFNFGVPFDPNTNKVGVGLLKHAFSPGIK
jgi:hypothetical protein